MVKGRPYLFSLTLEQVGYQYDRHEGEMGIRDLPQEYSLCHLCLLFYQTLGSLGFSQNRQLGVIVTWPIHTSCWHLDKGFGNLWLLLPHVSVRFLICHPLFPFQRTCTYLDQLIALIVVDYASMGHPNLVLSTICTVCTI